MYNETDHVSQYCDGSQWVAMGPMGDAALNVPTSGLVGHWKLDETSGTTANDSAGSNNGTMSGGLDAGNDSVSGVVQNAINFNGTSDYINLGTSADIDISTGAISLWFKSDVTPATDRVLLDKDGSGNNAGDFTLRLDGGDQNVTVEFQNGSSTIFIDSDDPITPGEWTHVVWLFGASGLKMYINGTLQTDTDTDTTGITYSAPNLYIGSNGGGADYFDGQIDDVRLYNRTLSATEIQDLYLASSHNAGLVGHWKLDESSGGTTVTDSAGSYDGTFTNGTIVSIAGIKSQAFEFTGASSEYVEIGDIPEIDGISKLTMSAWIRRKAPNDFVEIGKQHGASDATVAIEAWSDGKIYFSVTDGTNAYNPTIASINDTEWHHTVLVYDGTQAVNNDRVIAYVDGALEPLSYPTTIPTTTTTNTKEFRIGQIPGAYTNGYIDDVRLYNRTLSTSEVQRLYGCTAPNDIEGTILYNSANSVMQYCNGVDWMGIGK